MEADRRRPDLTASALGGVGSSTISTARAFGNALGVALLLAVHEKTKGFSWPFIVAGIICPLAVPLAFFLRRRLGDELAEA